MVIHSRLNQTNFRAKKGFLILVHFNFSHFSRTSSVKIFKTCCTYISWGCSYITHVKFFALTLPFEFFLIFWFATLMQNWKRFRHFTMHILKKGQLENLRNYVLHIFVIACYGHTTPYLTSIGWNYLYRIDIISINSLLMVNC